MLAICKVHEAGVMHGGLEDYRHFVMRDRRVFLVDFSRASKHVCRNSTPELAHTGAPSMLWYAPVGCTELYAAERKFGDANV